MINRVRSFIATVAAIGAVRRHGIGALRSYAGKVEGKGVVKHKDGTETEIVMAGSTAEEPQPE